MRWLLAAVRSKVVVQLLLIHCLLLILLFVGVKCLDLVSSTWCPFWSCIYLTEKERSGCIAFLEFSACWNVAGFVL